MLVMIYDNLHSIDSSKLWYVIRDFEKRNAKFPGYELLPELGIQSFTLIHLVVAGTYAKPKKYFSID